MKIYLIAILVFTIADVSNAQVSSEPGTKASTIKEFDKDGDGLLSSEELLGVLELRGIELRRTMPPFDLNSDGQLNLEEAKSWYEEQIKPKTSYQGKVHIFTSTDGRKLEGVIVSKTDSTVIVKRLRDQSAFELPLDRVSAADREFVLNWCEAKQAFDDARGYHKEGEYAKALERHEWFHENALQIRPSLSGVRLSFALSDWVALGSKYAPALESLERVRDQGAEALLSGKGSEQTFGDVWAINAKISRPDVTIDLYREIGVSQPELAKQCLSDVRFVHDLIAAGEDELFATYVGDMTVYLDERIKAHIELCESIKKGTSPEATVVFDKKLKTLSDFMAGIARENGNTNLGDDLESMTAKAISTPSSTLGEQDAAEQPATTGQSK